MKIFYSLFIALIFLSYPLSSQTPTASFATWQNNKKAAYSIIHDDYSNYVTGIAQFADPIATARGIKLTIGAITSACTSVEWAKARTMISHGHECMNHSHSHSCGGTPDQCAGLTTYGPADFALELDGSTQLIESNTGVRPLFFIHPYDAPSTDIINHLQNDLGYIGSRAGSQDAFNSSNFTDFMRLNFYVWGPTSLLPSLNASVNATIAGGGYALREFHGIEDASYAAMTVPNYTAHLDFVKSKIDDGSLWSATTSEVITYKMQRDAYQPAVTYTASTGIINVAFTSIGTIRTNILKAPVTVNVNLNGIAGTYDVKQGTTVVPSTRVGNIISFNVYPHQGGVTLQCNNCNPVQVPNNVLSFLATPQTNAVNLSWTNPSSNFDEVMIVAKPLVGFTTAPVGNVFTADPNFTGNGTAFEGGKVVYKGVGLAATVSNLTAGTRYFFRAYSRLGTTWSNGVEVNAVPTAVVPLQPLNVVALTAVAQTNAVMVDWKLPTSNFDEVLIVAKPISGVLGVPSGNSYTADANFLGSGTSFDGGKVIYKGTGSNVTVTSLTAGIRYYFRAFSRLGTVWSTGVEVNAVPLGSVVTAEPGCLKGSYFSNVNLSGTPIVRAENKIDYNWAGASPLSGIPSTNFSVRWEGVVNPPLSGQYTFTVTADDGVRVYVNNLLLINHFVDQSPTTYTATINLTLGQAVPIRVEYYQRGGGTQATLAWTIPTQTSRIIAFTACPIVQPPTTVFDATKCYTLMARHSSKFMEVQNIKSLNSPLEQRSASRKTEQIWRIKATDASGSFYSLLNTASGYVASVNLAQFLSNTAVIQTSPNNSIQQHWQFLRNPSGFYQIISKLTTKAMDVTGSGQGNGVNIIQYPQTNGANQQWRVTEAVCPTNAANLTDNNRINTFTGRLNINEAVLSWAVKSLDFTDYYELQKLDSLGYFQTLTTINGNSVSEVRTFSYIDKNLVDGDNIYRVKTFDIDGNVQVSAEINVDYKQIDHFTIFPNPADVECHIDLSQIVGQSVDISLITPFGKVVRVENIVSASDQYLMSLDNIENGYYFIKIQAKGKRAVVQKLIIAK